MLVDDRVGQILLPDEKVIDELRGELRLPTSTIEQCNGRLVATNQRLIFLCEVREKTRQDTFPYKSIERIVIRNNFKNEPRVLFEADDEIQMLQNIIDEQNVEPFIKNVQKYL